jgi:hypothetical protein
MRVKGGSCFIVSPVFYDDADFLLKEAKAGGQANPDRLAFVVPGDSRHRFFEDRIDFRFYGISGLPDDMVPAGIAATLAPASP